MAAPIVPDGVAGGARYGYHPGIQTSNPSHIQIINGVAGGQVLHTSTAVAAVLFLEI
eukprot:gene2500-2736_t